MLETRLAPAGLATALIDASRVTLLFDSGSDSLSIVGSGRAASAEIAVNAAGALSLSVNGQAYSNILNGKAFMGSVAGLSLAKLHSINLQGGGWGDTLSVNNLSTTSNLTVTTDGSLTFAGQDQIAGALTVMAHTVSITGAIHASRVAMTTTDFVNVGQVGTVGAQGGSITIHSSDVQNTGTINASGSSQSGAVQIEFTHSYIDTAGSRISASSVAGNGGQITVASTSGRLFSSGQMDATGHTGGSIELLGQDILLVGSSFNVSGHGGDAGQIRVGGPPHSNGASVPTAQTIEVTPTTTLIADAQASGNAGRVTVWSRANTVFTGSVSAQGGTGGFIEISSAGQLTYAGSAKAGKNGTLLLDPKYLVISTASSVFPQYILVNPGSGGAFGTQVLTLSTGNIVVTDPKVNNNAGAVYLFSGQSGTLLSVLSGSTNNPQNDSVGIGGVTALTNGNFVVSSPNWDGLRGAATWGSGVTGINGTVSASNSLIGTTTNDQVGLTVTALSNGNYITATTAWDDNLGAATWGSGSTGVVGVVSSTNSLTGSAASDFVGSSVVPLTNGNYVVSSPAWNGRRGAATWGNGTTGTNGVVSATNSLVGTNATDFVGSGVTALSNGNYVVSSGLWNNSLGAATWGSGTTGITGTISSTNSLVGSTSGDQVGTSVTALTNGNYVVGSQRWNGGIGAATWGNGGSGVTGTINASNSLVGANANDQIASTITALTNGNYVVGSPQFNNATGAATWGNGSTGITGTISTLNSLLGGNTSDRVGSTIVVLTNGNYVVASPFWQSSKGAATWGSGTAGVIGVISGGNSLIGTSSNDMIGSSVTPLTNGSFVVGSPQWSNTIGAATWSNGTSILNGTITNANSLIGSQPNDLVGSNVSALSNGNYVVSSPTWNGTGAATWGNGTTGVSGLVTVFNSLTGNAGDQIGSSITPLSDGNYVVNSPHWTNGLGAATLGNGATGSTIDGQPTVNTANSVVGVSTNNGFSAARAGIPGSSFLAAFPNQSGGNVVVGLTSPNQFGFATAQGQTITLSPSLLATSLNAGTNVILQANDDITISSPIIVSTGGVAGNLTLQAGRSIFVTAIINSGGGNLSLIANDTKADGVVDSQRDPGNAVIAMASGVSIYTSGGTLTIDLKKSTDKTNNGAGAVTLSDVSTTTATLSKTSSLGIAINGTSPGNGVTPGTYTQVTVEGSINLNGAPLQFSHDVSTSANTTYTIIHTTGGSVTGTFAGLPEGATLVASDGATYTISYLANGGTDVVLTQSAVASQLGLSVQPPTSVAAGVPFGFTVKAVDSAGDLATSYNGTATVSLGANPGNSILGGTLTVNFINGLATFGGLTLNHVASGYMLKVTSSTLTATTTPPIAVTPALASQLVIVAQPPAQVGAGSAFGFTVNVEDSFGNVVTTSSNSVTASLVSNPGSSTLSGTTSVSANAGVAAFSGLSLNKLGVGYTIQVASPGLTSATTSAITVTAGLASQLVIVTQPPSSVTVNAPFGLVLNAEDSAGNLATSFNGTVSLAISNNPGGGTLGGIVTVAANKGVVTFSGLSITQPGSGYTLQATGSGLTSVTTTPMTVVAIVPTQLVVGSQPPVIVGAAHLLVLLSISKMGPARSIHRTPARSQRLSSQAPMAAS